MSAPRRPRGASSRLPSALRASSSQIAHAHGGRIEVTASEHSGNTFAVHLPR